MGLPPVPGHEAPKGQTAEPRLVLATAWHAPGSPVPQKTQSTEGASHRVCRGDAGAPIPFPAIAHRQPHDLP